MTVIRFMRDKARAIVLNKDPRFSVVLHEQREMGKGVYLITTLIRELQTGRYYKACYTLGARSFLNQPIRPFDADDPLFQEVEPGKNPGFDIRSGILMA